MNFPKKNLMWMLGIVSGILLLNIAFVDMALFEGLMLVALLTIITFFIFYKFGIKSKTIYILFLIALFIHIAITLFFHYAQFQPFGGGDFIWYQEIAEQIAQRINQGVYSLEGINMPHYYPVLIGVIYALTLPKMIIGQLFSAWLSALSVAFVFLLVKEISGSKYWPFLIGLMVAVYPGYLFFGSLLLKDTVIIPLVLAGLLVSVKMLKNFSWQKFVVFFAVLTALIHFRFYVGFALLLSFVICSFLISNFEIKKRILYGLGIIFILGFSPLILGYGYYGIIPLKGYLNKETITVYREVVYAPVSSFESTSHVPAPTIAIVPPVPVNSTKANVPADTHPKEEPCLSCGQIKDSGVGSSFVVGAGFDNPFKFTFNYFVSFMYSLLGPFPWQIKHARQALALLETIPWYILISIFVYGMVKSITTGGFLKTVKHYRLALPLFLFSIMALGALSLFINNFGIITRIRMPALIALLCVISLDQWSSNKLQKLLDLLRYQYENKVTKLYHLPFSQKKSDPGNF